MTSIFIDYVKFILAVSIFIIFIFIASFATLSSAKTNEFPENLSNSANSSFAFSNNGWIWPIPGYTKISSYFGNRKSPTAGASSYHSGLDIPAPEGTPLYSIARAKVIFASWGAGGGYTITLQLLDYDNIKVSYCHVSPIMYVSYGENIEQNKIIGCVGPKNVYGIKNNPYKDSNGNPTNGASTGCHLHFSVKINNKNVDPLAFYDIN